MRKLIFAFILLSWSTPCSEAQAPIKIFVGSGNSVTITIPGFSKPQLTEMVSMFFARGDEEAEKRFKAVIGKASSLTLIVTTSEQIKDKQP